MRTFNLSDIELTKYLFFTGKGGVGKTSIACATAVGLADNGKKILLISTDPASNLQDVFNQTLNGHGTDIQEVPGLTVVNLDPEQAAAEYRESVIAPFRGKLPDSVIQNMEEQLSGSCTVEIAAFNQFSDFITDADKAKEYDHIIFDTAPTGHTLRMLQLPSAWSTFISESTHGASCLGQLSGLEERKGIYKQAVEQWNEGKRLRYDKLDPSLQKHKNTQTFLNRFCVVDPNGVCHTVVAHIAMDGHYYIYPTPNPTTDNVRSITIREAARIQSFPDDYFFEGSRSSAFKQIGNAVPVVLAEKIALEIKKILAHEDELRRTQNR